MRRLGAAIALVSLGGACTSSGAPPSAPTGAAAPVTTVTIDAGAVTGPVATDLGGSQKRADPPASPPSASTVASGGTGDGGADFYACNVDSDCVAVPKVACCPTGHLEAVNKQSVSAYESSFVCEMKHRICPMYRVMDKRQPVCDSSSHKCELLPPDQIACGGPAPSAHLCPSGFQCDSGGHCKANP